MDQRSRSEDPKLTKALCKLSVAKTERLVQVKDLEKARTVQLMKGKQRKRMNMPS